MGIKIREGLFETNSSSSHAIVFQKAPVIRPEDFDNDDLKPDKSGELLIATGEFGWGPDRYDDSLYKASYALTYASHYAKDKLPTLERVLMAHTGAKTVKFVGCGNVGEYDAGGYIDHASADVCESMFECDETLDRFIFDPRYILLIANDNI